MILMALDDVRPGMALGIGIRNRQGIPLLGPGVELTPEAIRRLRELGIWAVWIDDEDTRDIPYEDSLSDATRLATTIAIQETFALTARETAALRSASVSELREALNARRFQHLLDDHPILERLSGHVDQLVSEVLDRPILTGLASIRTRDTYTFHHCLDVTVTATMIGRLLHYDRETLKKLATGCILHDIGKIFLDDVLLTKPGPYSADDARRMRDHTVLGYLFLRDNLRLGLVPAHIAYQHHEWQDGTGYPRGLTGTNRVARGAEIHVPGRMMPMAEIAAIADFHDACSSDRPHRRPYPPDQVWRMIRDGAGRQFNREIAEQFLQALPPFPVTTQVVVTSGAWQGFTGVVARLNREALDRPIVRLLADAAQERIEPVELDLLKDETVRIRGAVRPPRDDAAREAPPELAHPELAG
jgi:HD-GYP domain-containing protein (c-di-GMP phosphodiesterase class II)